MEQFLIIRLSSLGDIIHTLPAFSSLRKHFPRAKINWLTEEKGKDILDLVPELDEIIPSLLKKWPWSSQKFWREFFHLKESIQKENQTVLDFQGLLKSGFMAYLSRGSRKIGFHRQNLKEPGASFFYNIQGKPFPEDIHVIEKNLRLLSSLGIQETRYDFPLRIPEKFTESIKDKLNKIGYVPTQKLVLLNIGAAWKTKRWFPERWIELIHILKKKKHLFFLILWGDEEERSLAFHIHQKTDVSVAPYLTLKGTLALIKESSLLVSGDTFALQAADALSCPVVGIFGPTNPRRNGPFRPWDKVAFHEMECSYCYKKSCSNLECLKKIHPQEVSSLCEQVLEKDE